MRNDTIKLRIWKLGGIDYDLISSLKSLRNPEENRSCGGFEKYVKGMAIKRFLARF